MSYKTEIKLCEIQIHAVSNTLARRSFFVKVFQRFLKGFLKVFKCFLVRFYVDIVYFYVERFFVQKTAFFFVQLCKKKVPFKF